MNFEKNQQETVLTAPSMSEEETRFEQVKQEEYAKILSDVDGRYITNQNAEDNAHVAAWLDKLARRRQLRVERSLIDDDEYAFHSVQILHENENGEVVPIECGGWVEMYELHRGYMDGPGWLYKKEEVSDGWVRIKLMIGENFPDHPMFKRADGTRIDLGFNGDDHFFVFTVVMHQDDLIDKY